MDINIVNTILIILIIIIVINHLTNNKVMKTISNFLHNIKSEKIYDLGTILKKISTPNNIKQNFNMNYPIYASKQMIKLLGHKLDKTLNTLLKKYNYKLRNLVISNNVIYYKSNIGKYFKPFYFVGKLYSKKKASKISLKIELFVKQNTNELVILNITKEVNNYSDILTDNNIASDKNTAPINIVYNQDQEQDKDKYNNIFLKTHHNIEENNSSLVPSVVNITPYDTACETQSACESTCNTATNTATNTAES